MFPNFLVRPHDISPAAVCRRVPHPGPLVLLELNGLIDKCPVLLCHCSNLEPPECQRTDGRGFGGAVRSAAEVCGSGERGDCLRGVFDEALQPN